jgi:Tfp pilus assembly protein PilO
LRERRGSEQENMNKIRISKKEWHLLLICIIIIVAFLLDTAIRQAYTKFSNLEKEIRLTEQRLGRLNGILRQREQIQSGYARVIPGLRQIKTSDDFLQEIEKAARSAGLNILNIKPAATKQQDLYKIYSVNIEAQDEIKAVAKFLYIFNKEFKGMGVEQLQINARRQKELPKVELLINAIEFKE